MATKGDSTGSLFGNPKMSSLEEDFTYGVTVAQTNLKIRLGVFFLLFIWPIRRQKVVLKYMYGAEICLPQVNLFCFEMYYFFPLQLPI